LHVFRFLPRRHVLRRNAAEKLVAGVDVVHEHADAAILDVIPDARLGDVEEVMFGGASAQPSGRQRGEQEWNDDQDVQGAPHGAYPNTRGRGTGRQTKGGRPGLQTRHGQPDLKVRPTWSGVVRGSQEWRSATDGSTRDTRQSGPALAASDTTVSSAV